MIKHAGLITSVSPERIAEELNKLLVQAEKPSIGLCLLNETGLLEYILPELQITVGVDQPGGYHRWDVFEHTLMVVDNTPPNLPLRLAALFHDVGKPATRHLVEGGATFYGHDMLSREMAEKAMQRLRYSNDLIKDVGILVGRHMFSEKAGDKGIRRLISRVGIDLIMDLIALRRADTLGQGMGQTTESVDEFQCRVEAELASSNAFGLKDLEVDGNILKERFNIGESPLVGEILNYLLESVLDNPKLNKKDELIELSCEFLNKRQLDIGE
jgi:tRNA nucleotidyltransferase (CCA-adding enzyme)